MSILANILLIALLANQYMNSTNNNSDQNYEYTSFYETMNIVQKNYIDPSVDQNNQQVVIKALVTAYSQFNDAKEAFNNFSIGYSGDLRVLDMQAALNEFDRHLFSVILDYINEEPNNEVLAQVNNQLKNLLTQLPQKYDGNDKKFVAQANKAITDF